MNLYLLMQLSYELVHEETHDHNFFARSNIRESTKAPMYLCKCNKKNWWLGGDNKPFVHMGYEERVGMPHNMLFMENGIIIGSLWVLV